MIITSVVYDFHGVTIMNTGEISFYYIHLDSTTHYSVMKIFENFENRRPLSPCGSATDP